VVRRLALLVGALACAGCPALHDGYPTTSCNLPSECFCGETCVDHVCVPLDGATCGDDGATEVDASAPDEATPIDAATPIDSAMPVDAATPRDAATVDATPPADQARAD
jgi:hypothetical protein